MAGDYEKMSFYEQLRAGLEDSIAYSKGRLSLKTTTLPAPPPKATPRSVTAIRNRLRMSQSVFAATLNVSTKTVQSWEQGTREPSDAALRFLQIIKTRPDVVKTIFNSEKQKSTAKRASGTSHRARRKSARRSSKMKS